MDAQVKSLSPTIEYSLLGLLGDRPMHGYELNQSLSQKTGLGLIWSVKQAHIYAILAKLEAEAYISGQVVAQGNRPPRRVFSLTDEGRQAYEAWVSSPVPRKDFRLDFLAKLYFAHREGREVAEALLAEQRKLCSCWVEEMSASFGSCDEGCLDSLVYKYRVGQLEAMLAWLDECAAYFRGVKAAVR
jgi:DNA-binding PadR family transcriptional regulator